MHYPLPLAMFGLTVGAIWYSRATAAYIGILRLLIMLAALLCGLVALLLAHGAPVVSAMVGVSSEEIDAFRAQFEEALRRAGLSMKEAAICFYGRDDHGRLRKELQGEGGGVSAVRMRRLGTRFHAAWLELEAEAQQVPIVTAATFDRVARLLAASPKPIPAAMQQEAVCVTQAS